MASKLVLIHESVQDSHVFSNNVLADVRTISVGRNDTQESFMKALSEIRDIASLTHVAIIFPNRGNRVPLFEYTAEERQAMEQFEAYKNTELSCPNEFHNYCATHDGKDVSLTRKKLLLQRHTAFARSGQLLSDSLLTALHELKTIHSSLSYVDIISCNINPSAVQQQQLDHLKSNGMIVRYSTDLTGKNGDWILESHDVNVTPVYFTKNVASYKYTLDITICTDTELLDLGTLPGGTYSLAYAVSNDGGVIGGESEDANGDSRAFIYTDNGGMVNIDTLPNSTFSYVLGLSGDGTVAAGRYVDGFGGHLFVWTQAGGMINIDAANPTRQYNHGYAEGNIISEDGSTIVGTYLIGFSAFEAIYYNVLTNTVTSLNSTIITQLGLPGGSRSQANGCSADGNVIFGRFNTGSGNDRCFVYYRNTNTVIEIPPFVVGNPIYPASISLDGTTVVGFSNIGTSPIAFYWTAATNIVNMGTLPGGTTSRAYSVSSDGAIIVGISEDSSGNDRVYIYNVASSSFVQTIIPPSNGYSYSTDIYGFSTSNDGSVVAGYLQSTSGTENVFRYTNGTLTDLGLLPTGTAYSYPTVISKDGSTITGYADVNNNTTQHAFKQVTKCIVIPSAEGDLGSLLCLNCVECATPNPQTGVYDSSRITENKEGRVIRDYIIKNGCQARPKPVFQSYADYMKYLNASLRH